MIWNDIMGGRTIRNLTYLGNNEWMTEPISLASIEGAPYWIYTLDMKVTVEYETVGETFYAQIQGSNEWKELTCVEVEPRTIEGLAAKFWLHDGVITVPATALAHNKEASVWAHILDMKATGVYEPAAGVFYAKTHGSSEWEPTYIEAEPGVAEMAEKFYLDDGAIVKPRLQFRRIKNNGKADTCAKAMEDKERGDTP